jgi:hypothetical protein
MTKPVSSYDIYFLQSEWLARRSDLAAVTLNSFDDSYRRITLTTCPLYDGSSRQQVGEYTSTNNQIDSLNGKFIHVLINSMVIITNKLILPNVTTGYIITNENSYDKMVTAIPPKTWTQDSNGKRVLSTTLPIQEGDIPGTFRFKIEVFDEDF